MSTFNGDNGPNVFNGGSEDDTAYGHGGGPCFALAGNLSHGIKPSKNNHLCVIAGGHKIEQKQ